MKAGQERKIKYGVIFWVVLILVQSIGKVQAQDASVLGKVAVYPTLILHNGKIATMDQNLTFRQAMAIRGERIWRLGTDAEIKPLAGPQTEIVDLKGRTVVPGLIDAHTHPHLWALPHLGGKYDAQLAPLYVDGKTLDEVKSRLGEAIQRRIQEAGPNKWIIVSVPWTMEGVFGQSGISRADLDRIAPQTPFSLLRVTSPVFPIPKQRKHKSRPLEKKWKV